MKRFLTVFVVAFAMGSVVTLAQEVTKYTTVSRRDVSGATGQRRLVHRVILEVDSVPDKERTRGAAYYIWEKENGKKWDDYTIQILLPGGQAPLAVVEFAPTGLTDITYDRLMGTIFTKWGK
jgi:hypothetical protein